MKTDRFNQALRTAIVLFAVVGVFSCKENDPELEFTPEEKETEIINVSDALYEFTLQYDDEKATGLDEALEKVRKNEFVRDVVKESDHVKVTYKNGLEIYYPFIMPSDFEGVVDSEMDAPEESSLLTKADPYGGYYRGKCKIFNYFSEDPSRAGQTTILKKIARRARFHLRLLPESGPEGYYEDMIVGKNKVTIENIEKAISDPSNEVVIIATHGFQNTVVTSESIEARSLSGLSERDLRDFMAQERLVACGEKDAKGNLLYNKGWYVKNYSGRWSADFVYFTGCDIFKPYVCESLNNNYFAYSLIAGWDGKNNIGEALLLALFDCFGNGMSFKDFYAQEGSHSDRSYKSNLVYAGKGTDYKPSDKTYTLDKRTSRFKYPRNFCEKTTLRTNTLQMILEDNLNKEGTFWCEVYDILGGDYKKSSKFHYEALYDLFDQIITSSDWSVTYWLRDPGVYQTNLYYRFTKNGVEQTILIDQKYIIKSNGYGVNGSEEDTVPTIKVATAATKAADLIYGCQMTVCPEDLIRVGFKVWEKDNPGQIMDVPGTPHEDNNYVFQASLNGLKAGTVYQAKAYIQYVTGDEFTGNVVEFTASNTSVVPTVPVPEAIDLGLPSGLKWASFNLGASSPEEVGLFLPWGEIESRGDIHGVGNYTENNYLWSNQELPSDISGTEYDPAHVLLGGKWMMPTEWMLKELLLNCTIRSEYSNGKAGKRITGKNGRSIFIPEYSEMLLPEDGHGWGIGNHYWLSNPFTQSEARTFYIGFDGSDYDDPWLGAGRYYDGLSYNGMWQPLPIRPVYCEDKLMEVFQVSSEKCEFGLVETGHKNTKSIAIANIGGKDLSLSIHVSGNAYSCSQAGSIISLPSGQFYYLDITYSPSKSGTDNGVLSIVSNSNTRKVSLTGQGTTASQGCTAQAVDLGLSVKWASCNIGANAPEDFGSYFAYGETEEKDTYNYSSYQGAPDVGSSIAGTEYDAAHVLWGDNWRLPTDEEFQELADNCSYYLETFDNIPVFRVVGPNGNSIVIPLTGCLVGERFKNVGDIGYFWVSGLSVGRYWYWWIYDQANYYDIYEYHGATIRPVYDSGNSLSSTQKQVKKQTYRKRLSNSANSPGAAAGEHVR